jgi:hypothetical protein
MVLNSCVYRFFLLMILVPPVSLAALPDLEVSRIAAITDDYTLFDRSRVAADDPVTINFVVAPGEYEPASFVVHANSSVKGLKIRSTGLHSPDGEVLEGANLDIRVVKRWYQRNVSISSPVNLRYLKPELLLYDDSLIQIKDGENILRLETGDHVNVSEVIDRKGWASITPTPEEFPVRDATSLQPVDLKANEGKQFWVTLHTLAGTPAGRYKAVIELIHHDEVVSVIPVTVEVLPFKLAEPSLEYSFFYRGRLDKRNPDGTVSSETKSEAQMLADLKNLREHGISNPLVYQKLDTGLVGRVMELRQQAGMNSSSVYFLGLNNVASNEGVVDPWLGDNVRKARATLSDYGVEDVYFYARDEASGEVLKKQLPLWREVKNAGGKIMAAGRQNTAKHLGNFEATGGEEDLFVCLGAFNQAEVQRWHDRGKLIYSYQNPTGGLELPQTWRRTYGLLLWQAGYDGGMPYAWQHSYGDGWNDFDNRERDHNFTYPAVDKPIDTLQWEGFREGVDDVRYLTTLMTMLESGEADNSPHADAARAWVDKLRALPLIQADLDKIRATNIAYILALSGWTGESTGSLELTDVNVSPIEPDGSAVVSWQTSVRADALLELNDKGSHASVLMPGAEPRATHHAVTVAGLKSGGTTGFSIETTLSVAADPVTASGLINADPSLEFQDISGVVNGEGLLVQFSAESDYRSSVGIDVGRSLLGWWRFTEPADEPADLSTWGHTGSLKGNAKIGEGWFGNGIALKGDGGFVSFPDIEIEENGAATIDGWYRFHSFAMDEVRGMSLFSGVYQHGENNDFYFSGTNESFHTGSLLSRNVWHHIALSWDGNTATAKMYIDGQAVPLILRSKAEEISEIDGLTVGRHVSYLGGLVRPAKNTFDGDIDEIRAWSRALSAAEIRASYRGGRVRQELQVENPSGSEAGWSIIGANAADEYVIHEP